MSMELDRNRDGGQSEEGMGDVVDDVSGESDAMTSVMRSRDFL